MAHRSRRQSAAEKVAQGNVRALMEKENISHLCDRMIAEGIVAGRRARALQAATTARMLELLTVEELRTLVRKWRLPYNAHEAAAEQSALPTEGVWADPANRPKRPLVNTLLDHISAWTSRRAELLADKDIDIGPVGARPRTGGIVPASLELSGAAVTPSSASSPGRKSGSHGATSPSKRQQTSSRPQESIKNTRSSKGDQEDATAGRSLALPAHHSTEESSEHSPRGVLSHLTRTARSDARQDADSRAALATATNPLLALLVGAPAGHPALKVGYKKDKFDTAEGKKRRSSIADAGQGVAGRMGLTEPPADFRGSGADSKEEHNRGTHARPVVHAATGAATSISVAPPGSADFASALVVMSREASVVAPGEGKARTGSGVGSGGVVMAQKMTRRSVTKLEADSLDRQRERRHSLAGGAGTLTAGQLQHVTAGLQQELVQSQQELGSVAGAREFAEKRGRRASSFVEDLQVVAAAAAAASGGDSSRVKSPKHASEAEDEAAARARRRIAMQHSADTGPRAATNRGAIITGGGAGSRASPRAAPGGGSTRVHGSPGAFASRSPRAATSSNQHSSTGSLSQQHLTGATSQQSIVASAVSLRAVRRENQPGSKAASGAAASSGTGLGGRASKVPTRSPGGGADSPIGGAGGYMPTRPGGQPGGGPSRPRNRLAPPPGADGQLGSARSRATAAAGRIAAKPANQTSPQFASKASRGLDGPTQRKEQARIDAEERRKQAEEEDAAYHAGDAAARRAETRRRFARKERRASVVRGQRSAKGGNGGDRDAVGGDGGGDQSYKVDLALFHLLANDDDGNGSSDSSTQGSGRHVGRGGLRAEDPLPGTRRRSRTDLFARGFKRASFLAGLPDPTLPGVGRPVSASNPTGVIDAGEESAQGQELMKLLKARLRQDEHKQESIKMQRNPDGKGSSSSSRVKRPGSTDVRRRQSLMQSRPNERRSSLLVPDAYDGAISDSSGSGTERLRRDIRVDPSSYDSDADSRGILSPTERARGMLMDHAELGDSGGDTSLDELSGEDTEASGEGGMVQLGGGAARRRRKRKQMQQQAMDEELERRQLYAATRSPGVPAPLAAPIIVSPRRPDGAGASAAHLPFGAHGSRSRMRAASHGHDGASSSVSSMPQGLALAKRSESLLPEEEKDRFLDMVMANEDKTRKLDKRIESMRLETAAGPTGSRIIQAAGQLDDLDELVDETVPMDGLVDAEALGMGDEGGAYGSVDGDRKSEDLTDRGSRHGAAVDGDDALNIVAIAAPRQPVPVAPEKRLDPQRRSMRRAMSSHTPGRSAGGGTPLSATRASRSFREPSPSKSRGAGVWARGGDDDGDDEAPITLAGMTGEVMFKAQSFRHAQAGRSGTGRPNTTGGLGGSLDIEGLNRIEEQSMDSSADGAAGLGDASTSQGGAAGIAESADGRLVTGPARPRGVSNLSSDAARHGRFPSNSRAGSSSNMRDGAGAKASVLVPFVAAGGGHKATDLTTGGTGLGAGGLPHSSDAESATHRSLRQQCARALRDLSKQPNNRLRILAQDAHTAIVTVLDDTSSPLTRLDCAVGLANLSALQPRLSQFLTEAARTGSIVLFPLPGAGSITGIASTSSSIAPASSHSVKNAADRSGAAQMPFMAPVGSHSVSTSQSQARSLVAGASARSDGASSPLMMLASVAMAPQGASGLAAAPSLMPASGVILALGDIIRDITASGPGSRPISAGAVSVGGKSLTQPLAPDSLAAAAQGGWFMRATASLALFNHTVALETRGRLSNEMAAECLADMLQPRSLQIADARLRRLLARGYQPRVDTSKRHSGRFVTPGGKSIRIGSGLLEDSAAGVTGRDIATDAIIVPLAIASLCNMASGPGVARRAVLSSSAVNQLRAVWFVLPPPVRTVAAARLIEPLTRIPTAVNRLATSGVIVPLVDAMRLAYTQIYSVLRRRMHSLVADSRWSGAAVAEALASSAFLADGSTSTANDSEPGVQESKMSDSAASLDHTDVSPRASQPKTAQGESIQELLGASFVIRRCLRALARLTLTRQAVQRFSRSYAGRAISEGVAAVTILRGSSLQAGVADPADDFAGWSRGQSGKNNGRNGLQVHTGSSGAAGKSSGASPVASRSNSSSSNAAGLGGSSRIGTVLDRSSRQLDLLSAAAQAQICTPKAVLSDETSMRKAAGALARVSGSLDAPVAWSHGAAVAAALLLERAGPRCSDSTDARRTVRLALHALCNGLGASPLPVQSAWIPPSNEGSGAGAGLSSGTARGASSNGVQDSRPRGVQDAANATVMEMWRCGAVAAVMRFSLLAQPATPGLYSTADNSIGGNEDSNAGEVEEQGAGLEERDSSKGSSGVKPRGATAPRASSAAQRRHLVECDPDAEPLFDGDLDPLMAMAAACLYNATRCREMVVAVATEEAPSPVIPAPRAAVTLPQEEARELASLASLHRGKTCVEESLRGQLNPDSLDAEIAAPVPVTGSRQSARGGAVADAAPAAPSSESIDDRHDPVKHTVATEPRSRVYMPGAIGTRHGDMIAACVRLLRLALDSIQASSPDQRNAAIAETLAASHARADRDCGLLADGSAAPPFLCSSMRTISFAIAALRNLTDPLAGASAATRQMVVRAPGVLKQLLRLLKPRDTDPFSLIQRGFWGTAGAPDRAGVSRGKAPDMQRNKTSVGQGQSARSVEGGSPLAVDRTELMEAAASGPVGLHARSATAAAAAAQPGLTSSQDLHDELASAAARSGHTSPGAAPSPSPWNKVSASVKLGVRSSRNTLSIDELLPPLPLPVVADAIAIVSNVASGKASRRMVAAAGAIPSLVPIAAKAPMSSLAVSRAFSVRLVRLRHTDAMRLEEDRLSALRDAAEAVDRDNHNNSWDRPSSPSNAASLSTSQTNTGGLSGGVGGRSLVARGQSGRNMGLTHSRPGSGASIAGRRRPGAAANRSLTVKTAADKRRGSSSSSTGGGAGAVTTPFRPSPSATPGSVATAMSPAERRRQLRETRGDSAGSRRTGARQSRHDGTRSGKKGQAEFGVLDIDGDVSQVLVTEQLRLEQIAARAREQCAVGLTLLATDMAWEAQAEADAAADERTSRTRPVGGNARTRPPSDGMATPDSDMHDTDVLNSVGRLSSQIMRSNDAKAVQFRAGILRALRALAQFGGNGDTIHVHVARALRMLSSAPGVGMELVAEGVIPVVLALSSSTKPNVRRECAGTIFNLSIQLATAEALVHEGAVSTLIALALVRCRDAPSQTLCVLALHNLLAHPSLRWNVLTMPTDEDAGQSSKRKGFDPATGAVIANTSASRSGVIWTLQRLCLSSAVSVQRACALAMRRLADDEDCRDMLVEEGGLKAAVQILLRSAEASAASAPPSGSIRELPSTYSRRSADGVTSQPSIAHSRDASRGGADSAPDSEVGALLAGVLGAVSRETGHEETLVKEGAVDALVLLATAGSAGGDDERAQAFAASGGEGQSGTAQLQSACALGLCNLAASPDATVRRKVIDGGAVDVFVGLGSGFPTVQPACSLSLLGLCHLLWAAGPSTQRAVLNAGAARVFTRLTVRKSTPGQVYAAALCLHACSCSRSLVAPLIADGGVTALTAVLNRVAQTPRAVLAGIEASHDGDAHASLMADTSALAMAAVTNLAQSRRGTRAIAMSARGRVDVEAGRARAVMKAHEQGEPVGAGLLDSVCADLPASEAVSPEFIRGTCLAATVAACRQICDALDDIAVALSSLPSGSAGADDEGKEVESRQLHTSERNALASNSEVLRVAADECGAMLLQFSRHAALVSSVLRSGVVKATARLLSCLGTSERSRTRAAAALRNLSTISEARLIMLDPMADPAADARSTGFGVNGSDFHQRPSSDAGSDGSGKPGSYSIVCPVHVLIATALGEDGPSQDAVARPADEATAMSSTQAATRATSESKTPFGDDSSQGDRIELYEARGASEQEEEDDSLGVFLAFAPELLEGVAVTALDHDDEHGEVGGAGIGPSKPSEGGVGTAAQSPRSRAAGKSSGGRNSAAGHSLTGKQQQSQAQGEAGGTPQSRGVKAQGRRLSSIFFSTDSNSEAGFGTGSSQYPGRGGTGRSAGASQGDGGRRNGNGGAMSYGRSGITTQCDEEIAKSEARARSIVQFLRRLDAAKALCNITRDPRSHAKLKEAGAATALLRVSDDPLCSRELRTACLRGLCELSIETDDSTNVPARAEDPALAGDVATKDASKPPAFSPAGTSSEGTAAGMTEASSDVVSAGAVSALLAMMANRDEPADAVAESMDLATTPSFGVLDSDIALCHPNTRSASLPHPALFAGAGRKLGVEPEEDPELADFQTSLTDVYKERLIEEGAKRAEARKLAEAASPTPFSDGSQLGYSSQPGDGSEPPMLIGPQSTSLQHRQVARRARGGGPRGTRWSVGYGNDIGGDPDDEAADYQVVVSEAPEQAQAPSGMNMTRSGSAPRDSPGSMAVASGGDGLNMPVNGSFQGRDTGGLKTRSARVRTATITRTPPPVIAVALGLREASSRSASTTYVSPIAGGDLTATGVEQDPVNPATTNADGSAVAGSASAMRPIAEAAAGMDSDRSLPSAGSLALQAGQAGKSTSGLSTGSGSGSKSSSQSPPPAIMRTNSTAIVKSASAADVLEWAAILSAEEVGGVSLGSLVEDSDDEPLYSAAEDGTRHAVTGHGTATATQFRRHRRLSPERAVMSMLADTKRSAARRTRPSTAGQRTTMTMDTVLTSDTAPVHIVGPAASPPGATSAILAVAQRQLMLKDMASSNRQSISPARRQTHSVRSTATLTTAAASAAEFAVQARLQADAAMDKIDSMGLRAELESSLGMSAASYTSPALASAGSSSGSNGGTSKQQVVSGLRGMPSTGSVPVASPLSFGSRGSISGGAIASAIKELAASAQAGSPPPGIAAAALLSRGNQRGASSVLTQRRAVLAARKALLVSAYADSLAADAAEGAEASIEDSDAEEDAMGMAGSAGSAGVRRGRLSGTQGRRPGSARGADAGAGVTAASSLLHRQSSAQRPGQAADVAGVSGATATTSVADTADSFERLCQLSDVEGIAFPLVAEPSTVRALVELNAGSSKQNISSKSMRRALLGVTKASLRASIKHRPGPPPRRPGGSLSRGSNADSSDGESVTRGGLPASPTRLGKSSSAFSTSASSVSSLDSNGQNLDIAQAELDRGNMWTIGTEQVAGSKGTHPCVTSVLHAVDSSDYDSGWRKEAWVSGLSIRTGMADGLDPDTHSAMRASLLAALSALPSQRSLRVTLHETQRATPADIVGKALTAIYLDDEHGDEDDHVQQMLAMNLHADRDITDAADAGGAGVRSARRKASGGSHRSPHFAGLPGPTGADGGPPGSPMSDMHDIPAMESISSIPGANQIMAQHMYAEDSALQLAPQQSGLINGGVGAQESQMSSLSTDSRPEGGACVVAIAVAADGSEQRVKLWPGDPGYSQMAFQLFLDSVADNDDKAATEEALEREAAEHRETGDEQNVDAPPPRPRSRWHRNDAVGKVGGGVRSLRPASGISPPNLAMLPSTRAPGVASVKKAQLEEALKQLGDDELAEQARLEVSMDPRDAESHRPLNPYDRLPPPSPIRLDRSKFDYDTIPTGNVRQSAPDISPEAQAEAAAEVAAARRRFLVSAYSGRRPTTTRGNGSSKQGTKPAARPATSGVDQPRKSDPTDSQEAANGGDKEPANGGDNKEAAVGGDNKEAAVGRDNKEAAVGRDNKEAAVGGDKEAVDATDSAAPAPAPAKVEEEHPVSSALQVRKEANEAHVQAARVRAATTESRRTRLAQQQGLLPSKPPTMASYGRSLFSTPTAWGVSSEEIDGVEPAAPGAVPVPQRRKQISPKQTRSHTAAVGVSRFQRIAGLGHVDISSRGKSRGKAGQAAAMRRANSGGAAMTSGSGAGALAASGGRRARPQSQSDRLAHTAGGRANTGRPPSTLDELAGDNDALAAFIASQGTDSGSGLGATSDSGFGSGRQREEASMAARTREVDREILRSRQGFGRAPAPQKTPAATAADPGTPGRSGPRSMPPGTAGRPDSRGVPSHGGRAFFPRML